MMELVDDFQTRHSTITDSIQETYRIGNKLLDYVQKQVIIDYHLQGKQAKMEEVHPTLVKKAQSFLGMETYFDLSVSQIQGHPMSVADPHYAMLMKKQQEILKNIEGEYERHLQFREEKNLPIYDEATSEAAEEIE